MVIATSCNMTLATCYDYFSGRNMFVTIKYEQEAQLSQRDRAMRYVN